MDKAFASDYFLTHHIGMHTLRLGHFIQSKMLGLMLALVLVSATATVLIEKAAAAIAAGVSKSGSIRVNLINSCSVEVSGSGAHFVGCSSIL